MRALFVVLALAGCDKIFGLDYRTPPDAPAAGHDEDLDGVADVDDNCPGIKNKQTQDADGDGVGDACDPRPNVEGDRIAVFYAFDGNLQPDWVRQSGSWAFMEDQLVYQAGTDFERMIAANGRMFTPPFTVEAQFQIDAAPIGSEFSLVFAYVQSSSGFFCTIRRTADKDEIDAYSPGVDRITTVDPLDLDATFTARFSIEPDELTCDIKSDREPGGAATAQVDTPRTGPIGFEAKAADTRTSYVIVYTR